MIDLLPEQETFPHSEESERAVLGGVLIDPSILPAISGRLRAEDFYRERHQTLYEVMLHLQEERVGIDLRTLQAKLEQRGLLGQVGGLSYLTGLDLDLPDIGRVDTYVEIIKERSVRRRLINLAGLLCRNCLDGAGLDGPEALELARHSLDSISRDAAPRGGFAHVARGVDRVAELIEDPDRTRQLLKGIPTGFPALDGMGGGLRPGRVMVVAGRPGMGKTSFALDIARHVALREGRTVTITSLEMTEEELTLRLICAEAGVPLERLRTGWLSRSELGRMQAAASALYAAPLWIDDCSSGDLSRIEGALRSFAAEQQPIAVAIVDYLGLMETGKRHPNRNEEVGKLSRRLKEIAGELALALVLLSQLNRESTRRSGSRPTLADLRESGSIEADADQVVLLHRPEYYEPNDFSLKGQAIAIVDKYRDGRTGDVPLLWDGPLQSFRPAPPPGPDPFA